MGFLYEGVTLISFLGLILFVLAWVLLNELARRSKWLSFGLFCILPIALAILVFTGVMGSPTGNTWFGWVKVVSALIGVYGFMAIRFTKWGKTKFAAIFPAAILSLNIAEAIYREFEIFFTYKEIAVDAGGSIIQGGPWNILNALAGVLTIITLTGFVGIRAAKTKSQDMVWPDMTWMYIIGYTIWNYAYVYNCISIRSMYAGFGILTAALIAEFVFKKGVWLQHRAQILSLYAMYSLSVDYQQSKFLNIVPTEATYTGSGKLIISIIAFAFNLGVFIYLVYTAKKTKRNPIKEALWVDTKYYKKSIEVNNL